MISDSIKEDVLLGEVASFIRGINFKPKDVVPEGTDGAVACMRTKNVQKELDVSDVWFVDRSFVKRDEQMMQSGDILISSANSWNLVGKCCWIPDLPWSTSFGGFVSVLRADPKRVFPRYLYHWFASPRIQLTARSFGRQTTNISNLDMNRCKKLQLKLPSLAEQKRIAEVLDRAEALRARRRAALALLDELTQSIFLDMFGDPLPNPKEWETVKLKEVLELITYGLTVRPKYVPDGIPLISGKEIRGGTIDFDAAAKMSEGDFEGLSDKAKPAENDLLFSKTGSIGHTALVDTARVFALAQNVARLTFDAAKVNNVFALHFLRSTSVQQLAQRSVRGNAVKDLQLGVMGDFPFILPPLESQCLFAKRIGALAELSLTHQRAIEGCNELFASLQSRAFRGELFDGSQEPVGTVAE